MAEVGTSMPGPVADFGATPEARALRIRAGVLLPFWQDRLRQETGEGVEADRRRDVYAAQAISAGGVLAHPDAEPPERFEGMIEMMETWARFAEAPAAEQDEDERGAAEEAELIRQALPERDKRPAPGYTTQFLKGAFFAWLRGRRDGEELLLSEDHVEGGPVVSVAIATSRRFANAATLRRDEIPAQARVAGAKAVRAAFKELRS